MTSSAGVQGRDAIPMSYRAGLTTDPATHFDIIEPIGGSAKPPVLLIHGGGHTGACYLATADGRPGWAHAFVERGYRVAVVDWPGCGRSGHVPYDQLDGEKVVAGLAQVLESFGEPAIVVTHSMSGPFGWKLLERHGDQIAQLVGIAPGPPGNIQAPAVVVGETPEWFELQLYEGGPVSRLSRQEPFAATRGFVDHKLVGKSRLFAPELVDRYALSLIPIPPRLIAQRRNVGGSQLKVEDFSKFAGKRVLVLSATDDVDHPVEIDKPIADWLNQKGANAEFIYLGDLGIEGNGHMMMLESNSDELATLVIDWIEKG